MKGHILTLIFLIFTLLIVHGEVLQYQDNNNNIIYKYDTDTYSDELGYGEAVAWRCTGATFSPRFICIEDYIEVKDYSGYKKYRVVEIGDKMCYDKSPITSGGAGSSLVIPQFVRRIGSQAFYGCSGFTGIIFRCGKHLKEIGDGAFYGCSKIETANFSHCKSLEVIGDEAFSECHNLKSISIPDSVKSIGLCAFANCEKLSSLRLSYEGNLKVIGPGAFFCCSNLSGTLYIPEGVERIYNGAFQNTSFSALKLPSTLLSIGSNAFSWCENLHGTLVIPDKVEDISSYAFEGCENISGCLIIGEKVSYIGPDAFNKIGNVSVVMVKSQIPPNGGMSFDELYQKAKLFVPKGTITEYSQAEMWKYFVDIEELDYTAPQKLEATVGNATIATDKPYSGENILVFKSGERIPVGSVVTPSNPVNDIVDWISEDTTTCVVKDGFLEIRSNSHTFLTANTHNGLKLTFEIQGGNPISEIELPDTVVVRVDERINLSATVKPSDCFSKLSLKWEVSNPSIVKLEGEIGPTKKLTGIETGFTKLTVRATDGSGVTNSCIVHVIPPDVASVTLDKTTFNYGVYDSHEPIQLTANVSPKKACQDVVWTSSDEQIATVDSTGLVTFHGYGEVRIKAASVENENKYDVCTISLEYLCEVLHNGRRCVNSNSFVVYKEDDVNEFRFNFKPSALPVTDISFSSEDDTILSVDAEGNAKWVREGRTWLYCDYTLYGEIHRLSYRVLCYEPQYIEEIILSDSNIDVDYNDTFTLSLTTSPEDPPYRTIEWVSTDDSIVRFDTYSDKDARLRAVGSGEADVIAKAESSDAMASCHIRVKPIIRMNMEEATLEVAETVDLVATILPETATDKSVTWESSDEAVAIVDAGGKVTALSVGNATITATAVSGNKATCSITVVDAIVSEIIIDKEALGITDNTLKMMFGETRTIKATVLPEFATDKSLIYISSDNGVASVDANGNVTAHWYGTATITIIANSNYDVRTSISVTVPTMPAIPDVEEIIIDKDALGVTDDVLEMRVGEVKKINVSVKPETNTSPSLFYASTDNDVVYVNPSSGEMRAISVGSARIWVTANSNPDVKAKLDVEVLPLASSIEVEPTSIEALVGDEIQLTAKILPELASRQELDWQSSNSEVASVSSTGLVKILKEGMAVIKVWTTDGTGLFAGCIIYGTASVESILADADSSPVDVYNLQGVCLMRNATASDIRKLAPGFYIIVGKKVLIK